MKQKYKGKANWNVIKKVKESVSIPVIGNGDILKPGAAKAMIEQTKCDYVILGRGAIGNPFIFKQINYLLDHGKNMPDPSNEDVKKAFSRFTELYMKQERKKITELRQHAMWFTKGTKNSKQLKQKLMKVTDFDELNKMFMNSL
jgi:tRNA-dihydrouridine synthase B